jgi:hypothetical protein
MATHASGGFFRQQIGGHGLAELGIGQGLWWIWQAVRRKLCPW